MLYYYIIYLIQLFIISYTYFYFYTFKQYSHTITYPTHTMSDSISKDIPVFAINDFFVYHNLKKINKRFYTVHEFYPYLNTITSYHDKIVQEIKNVHEWTLWPEKHLLKGTKSTSTWTIFPFFAFGSWVPQNCTICPTIYNFIKQIPGLRLATLSKLNSGMKLSPHKGWGNHSNYVIRCHYGIIVPYKKCYIDVENHKKYHKEKKWLIFDDSKMHHAYNSSNEDRIVLIIDIQRPYWIQPGTSKVGDTKELLDIIQYFKEMNLSYT